jgi:hypothetical protein
MKKNAALLCIAMLLFTEALSALPYIPGCPLHESCVRALRAEQRARRREQKNREGPGLASAAHNLNWGLMAGLDDIANRSRTPLLTLKPSLGYFNNFGDIDLYLGAFYTAIIDDPLRQQAGMQESLAYNIYAGDTVTITFSIDNDNQLTLAPGDFSFLYAAFDPAVTVTRDLEQGDFFFALGFPVDYSGPLNGLLNVEGDNRAALDFYATAGYNAPFGLGLLLSSRLWLYPEFSYGESEITLAWTRSALYLSLAVTADNSFTVWSITPYCAYTIGRITLIAQAAFDNIGANGTGNVFVDADIGARRLTIVPSLGIRFRV